MIASKSASSSANEVSIRQRISGCGGADVPADLHAVAVGQPDVEHRDVRAASGGMRASASAAVAPRRPPRSRRWDSSSARRPSRTISWSSMRKTRIRREVGHVSPPYRSARARRAWCPIAGRRLDHEVAPLGLGPVGEVGEPAAPLDGSPACPSPSSATRSSSPSVDERCTSTRCGRARGGRRSRAPRAAPPAGRDRRSRRDAGVDRAVEVRRAGARPERSATSCTSSRISARRPRCWCASRAKMLVRISRIVSSISSTAWTSRALSASRAALGAIAWSIIPTAKRRWMTVSCRFRAMRSRSSSRPTSRGRRGCGPARPRARPGGRTSR